MLSSSRVEANIPAADLHRARDFYTAMLGLSPVDEIPGVQLAYETDGGTRFNLYETEYAGKAGHTIAQWHVDDVAAEVSDLKAKGVVFEVYDLPGVEWDGEIATLPEVGKAAWFRDSEGNIMCVDQDMRQR
jgi:predicted enzyme related to lactoylglutathione lyase